MILGVAQTTEIAIFLQFYTMGDELLLFCYYRICIDGRAYRAVFLYDDGQRFTNMLATSTRVISSVKPTTTRTRTRACLIYTQRFIVFHTRL